MNDRGTHTVADMEPRARHDLYLDAMGIQRWVSRGARTATAGATPAAPWADAGLPSYGVAEPAAPSYAEPTPTAPRGTAPMGEAPCAANGAPPSDFRHPSRSEDIHYSAPPALSQTATGLDWDELARGVSTCTACPLHRIRTQTVFGVGNRQASWLVIGEAPGEQEDLKGEPFVGRAGQLLNEMLRATGYPRDVVYIANVLKCRPPGNRDPKPEEVAACEPYLRQQVALLQPAIILAVGRIAAQNLLKTDAPLSKLRGQVHRYGSIPLVVVYHPAYLLRSPGDKRKAWDDLRLALTTYRKVIT